MDIVHDPCETVVVTLDETAPLSARADLSAAIDMWEAVGDFKITTEPVPGAPRVPIKFQEAAPFFHGVYDDERGEVIINLELPEGHDTAVTLAHELGHSFGLWHAPAETDSVMIKGNLSIEPTHTDVVDLADVWGSCD